MPAASNEEWPFQEPKNLAVITTNKILRGGKPILFVVHNQDGDWQFLDGGEVNEADALIVGLGEMIRRDDSLRALADLSPGWQAWRAALGSFWQRSPVS